MATIKQAINKGVLEPFPLPEWETRPARRPLYLTPELLDWADNKPELVSDAHIEGKRYLIEHMIQIICDFRCAERPSGGDLKRMIPNHNRVWTLRPPRLRIYGWVTEPKVLVLVTAALETETKKDKSLNDTMRDAVVKFARSHQLEETMMKGDHRAVIHGQS